MTRNEAVHQSLMATPCSGTADIFSLDTYSSLKKSFRLPNAPIVHSNTKAKQNKILNDRQRQQDKRRR